MCDVGRRTANEKYIISLFPSETAVWDLQVQLFPPPKFSCSVGRQEVLSWSVCLNQLFSDLSHLQLWDRACGVLPCDDVSLLECNAVTPEIASGGFPAQGEAVDSSRPSTFIWGENWNWEGKAGPTEPLLLSEHWLLGSSVIQSSAG